MHAVTIRPVRLRLEPDEHGTVTLRTVGYRASCSCAWRGPCRRSYCEARRSGREHAGRDAELSVRV